MFLGISSKPWRRGVERMVKNWTTSSTRIRPDVLVPGDASLYTGSPLPEKMEFDYPERRATAKICRVNSCLARTGALYSQAFRYWMKSLKHDWFCHRKLWEYCYICQALYERGFLAPGKRGLGFAVGQEPLPAYFASLGCEVVASDLPNGDPRSAMWSDSAQWASGLEALNERAICPDDQFRARVKFRPVDMNRIPADLTGFDFAWSSCSFEHCGNIELGKQFIMRQMDCLRPGGLAVHTTEFNLSSNDSTLTEGATVIFRRQDIEDLAHALRNEGHEVEPLDLTVGRHASDRFIDREPYNCKGHMRLLLADWVSTSIGLIIRKRS